MKIAIMTGRCDCLTAESLLEVVRMILGGKDE